MAVTVIPYFKDNYAYLVQQGDRAVLFDCGDGEAVVRELKRLGAVPSDLYITHNHHDHADGIPYLKDAYPSITVLFPEEAGESESPIPMELIYTPGHTMDHCCFYIPSEQAVITGDTLFAGGCGRCFTGRFDLYCRSLQRVGALPETTRIFPAHEYLEANTHFLLSEGIECRFYSERILQENFPSAGITLADEKLLNPFLNASVRGDCAEFKRLRTAKDLF